MLRSRQQLFFPSLFAGPSFDYNEYRQWIEATMFEPPPALTLIRILKPANSGRYQEAAPRLP